MTIKTFRRHRALCEYDILPTRLVESKGKSRRSPNDERQGPRDDVQLLRGLTRLVRPEGYDAQLMMKKEPLAMKIFFVFILFSFHCDRNARPSALARKPHSLQGYQDKSGWLLCDVGNAYLFFW